MTNWVIAADAARARFFCEQSAGEKLMEIRDLVHPESRLHEQDLLADASGSGRQTAGGGDTFTDRHDARSGEAERFAREVAAVLDEARRDGRFDRLHVLAAPAFLGSLRAHLEPATRSCIAFEHAVNVTHESTEEIRQRLPTRL